jgi:hypothetical protein
MPQFDDRTEWKNFINLVEILELTCLNQNYRCANEYIKDAEERMYECELAPISLPKPTPSPTTQSTTPSYPRGARVGRGSTGVEPLSIKYSF